MVSRPSIIDLARIKVRDLVSDTEGRIYRDFIDRLTKCGAPPGSYEIQLYPLRGDAMVPHDRPYVFSVPIGPVPLPYNVEMESVRVPVALVDRFPIVPRFSDLVPILRLAIARYAPCVGGFFSGDSPPINDLISLGQQMGYRLYRTDPCNHLWRRDWHSRTHPYQIDELPKP